MPRRRHLTTTAICCGLLSLLSASSPASLLPSLSTAVNAASSDWTPAAAGRTGYNLNPVWSDEFSTSDTSKWVRENKAWPDNSELQFYSDDDKYASVSNDELVLTATDDKTGGRDYTSARLSTKGLTEFKHGLFAARMKLTKGEGIWPAFWLFGTGSKYSELDIAECAGGHSAVDKPPTGSGDDRACGSLFHFSVKDVPTNEVTRGQAVSHHLPNNALFADDYHVFWMEWTSTKVYVGVDTADQQTLIDDVGNLEAFQARMYLILNVAVGGDYPGNPDNTTTFPQKMHVDWVRVYNRANESVVTNVGDGGDNSNGGVSGSGKNDASPSSRFASVASMLTFVACSTAAAVFAAVIV